MKRRRGVHKQYDCPFCGEPYSRVARLFMVDGVYTSYRHEDGFLCNDVGRRVVVEVHEGVLFEVDDDS